GFSNGEGITLLAGVTQSNLFGTGNSLSTQINTSKINQTLSVSYTNPYYTDNGISRGFDAFRRRTDGTTTSISQFTSETYGGGVRFGVPVNDDESFQYGLSLEDTNLALNSNSPQQFIDYVNTFGTHNQNVLGTIGWTRDTRDSAVYATEGETQRAFLEASLPVSGQRFYKFTYIQQWFYPLTKELSLRLNGDLGVAGGYSGMELPFFKNLFAGGTGSVRGYDLSSLGPRDINNNSLGGTKRVVGNIELLFPIPGMEKNRSVRLSAFIDGGALSGKKSEVPASMGMRYSAGVGLNWFSPAGPLQFSWAKPLNDQPQDKVQNFQFTLGGFF
ncbi:MAG: outer membrane protein assembly factor BamA, partial [Gallionellaceae bacterium CG1_02_60_325]